MPGEVLGEVWAVAAAAGPVDVRVFVRGVTNFHYGLGANPQRILTEGVPLSNVIIQNLDPTISIELGNDRGLLLGQGIRIPPNSLYSSSGITPGGGSSVTGFGKIIVVTDAPYNAKGDGTSDDRGAIQSAINALPANGGIVFFPAGVYLVSTPGLTIGKGVRLVGSGKHTTVIAGTANAGYSLVSTVSGAGGGQAIEHLQLQGAGATNVSLNIKGVDNAHVHDCRFYGAIDAHIVLDHNNVAGAYTHRIDQNEIDCSVTAASVGIRLTNTHAAPASGITSTVISRNHIISDAPIAYVNFAAFHGGNTIKDNLLQARTAGVGFGIDWTANTIQDMVNGNYFQNFASMVRLAAGAGISGALAKLQHRGELNTDDGNTAQVTNANASGAGIVWTTTTDTSLNFAQAYLGGAVAMPVANTVYDGPTITLPRGTWHISASITGSIGAAGNGYFEGRIWDGATTYVSGESFQATGTATVQVHIDAVIVLAAPTAIRISATSTIANGQILAAMQNNALGATATVLKAVRVP